MAQGVQTHRVVQPEFELGGGLFALSLLAMVCGAAACGTVDPANKVTGGSFSKATDVGTDATDVWLEPLDTTAQTDAAANDASPAGPEIMDGSATDAKAQDSAVTVPVDGGATDALVADTPAAVDAAKEVLNADIEVKDVSLQDAPAPDALVTDAQATDGLLDAGGLSACCLPQKTKGCVDIPVQDCVCKQDAYCCTAKWDDQCAAEVVAYGCGKCSAGAGDASGSADSAKTDAADAGGGSDGGAAVACKTWQSARADLSEGAWSSNPALCQPGDMLGAGRSNTLKIVNLYRAMAGLPAVKLTDEWNPALQACATMMHANKALSHTPPANWACYQAAGAAAAGKSNLSTTPAVLSIDLYVVDPGNESTFGHRRWLLSNSLGPIGVGSTSGYSCLQVIGGTGKAGKAWTAWPPPGDVPLAAFHALSWVALDATGWTIQSDTVNLNAAVVTIADNGELRPIQVNALAPNYGSQWAISMVPKGWAAKAGATYHVDVKGIASPFAYDVHVVGCP